MTEKAKNRLPVAIVILLALFVVFWNRPSKLGSEFEPLGSETGTAGLPRRVRHVPTGIRLVLIEPGAFTMGTPETEPERDKDEIEHEITITEPFYLAETEVTVGLWRSLMGEEPWVEWDASDMPMTGVSWHRAKELVNTLNASGEGGWRLPTEAEWEYACRAGTTTVFSFGDDITTDQANFVGLYPYAGAPKGENREAPVPVASLPPNPWGLLERYDSQVSVSKPSPGQSGTREARRGVRFGAREMGGEALPGFLIVSSAPARPALPYGNDFANRIPYFGPELFGGYPSRCPDRSLCACDSNDPPRMTRDAPSSDACFTSRGSYE